MFVIKTLVVVAITALSLLGNPAKGATDDPPKIKTQEDYIKEIFGAKANIATAVLKHESGMKLDAVNYNCYYGKRSTFCKKEDRVKAWSVDCGIAQVNVKGKVCPKHLFTLEGNMKAVEKIYKEQGLEAWVSYKNGKYKQFMKTS